MRELSVYMLRTETVRETDCALLERRMPERFKKAMRFRFERDRLLCLGAGLLMMEALGLRDEREIRYGPYGKPYVPGLQAFSISHSGSRCLLACGDVAQIGADIEEAEERHIDVAHTVYTENELAWMKADPVGRFFQLWTWKESVMKATGMGLQLAPQSFEVLPFAEGRPVRVLGRSWYAWEDRLDRYHIAVCADEPIGGVRRIEFDGSGGPY